MPRGVRWVLAIAAGSVLMVGLAVSATVGAVYRAGTVSVHVLTEEGGDIHVAVPAGAANLALSAIEWVPGGTWPLDGHTSDALDDIRHYLPVAQEALERLIDQPDFVLVEADSKDEHVRVRKQGRTLSIVVESDGTRIDMTLPLSTVREFGKALRHIGS